MKTRIPCSCEFCQIFENNCYMERMWTDVSEAITNPSNVDNFQMLFVSIFK